MTNPPANESIAKRADSLVTISFDFGDSVCLNSLGVLVVGVFILLLTSILFEIAK